MKLLICIIFYLFCVYFLKREFKVRIDNEFINKKDTIYYWCIALMMISSLNYGSIIQYIIRIISICLSTYIIICKFISGKQNLKIINMTWLFLIYLGICLISTVYSINKFETFFKSIEMLLDFTVIWLLFSTESCNKVISNLVKVIFYVLMTLQITALVGYIIIPNEFSIEGTKSILGVQLGGGILGANAIGAVSILLIILMLNSYFKCKRTLLFISVITLILAQARTSLIIAIFILIIQLFSTKNKAKYIILVIPIILLVINNIDLINSYFLRGAAESNIIGMSGRKYMWELAKPYINNRPFLGYGFGAGGFIVSSQINMSSLHSAYYETLMGTGYVGATILLSIYIYSGILLAFNTIRKGVYNNSIEIMLFIFFTIRSYTSLGIANWHSHEMIVWIILFFCISTFKFHKGIINCINLKVKEVKKYD